MLGATVRRRWRRSSCLEAKKKTFLKTGAFEPALKNRRICLNHLITLTITQTYPPKNDTIYETNQYNIHAELGISTFV